MSQTKQLLDALQWRYATKIFDASKTIPADIWTALEKTLVLTPTSYGLQPYQFLIVQDAAKRAELLPHSWGQKQVVDCSHFVVFTARTEMKEADVDKLIKRTVELRRLPADAHRGWLRVDVVGDRLNAWVVADFAAIIADLLVVLPATAITGVLVFIEIRAQGHTHTRTVRPQHVNRTTGAGVRPSVIRPHPTAPRQAHDHRPLVVAE